MHDGLVTGLAPAKGLLEETLYDAHAARLHAYCWSLVGDDAPEAIKDTFVTVGRLGAPRGDAVPWLYALARAACYRRGALDHAFDSRRDPDPLERAAAGLRAEHREVLVLSAGEWLETPQLARLLGVAPNTVRQMIQAAASQLERAVLDTLMREPMSTRQDDVIAAFEKGRLPALLAGRAPMRPPALLRAEVLAGVRRPVAEPLAPPEEDAGTTAARPAVSGDQEVSGSPAEATAAASGPLVVIDARQRTCTAGPAGRRSKRAVEAAGLAAALAAAAGVLVALSSADGRSTGGDLAALIPSGGGNHHATATRSGAPGGTGTPPEIPGSVPFGHVTGMSPTPPPPPVSPDGMGLPFWPAPGQGPLPVPMPTAGVPQPTLPATGGRPGRPPKPRPSTPPSTPPSGPPSTPPSSTPTPPPSTPPPSTPPPSAPAPPPSEPADPPPGPTEHPEPGPSGSASESTGGSATR